MPVESKVRVADRGFFDLQIDFARHVAERSGLPLARALLDYTNLYVRLGFGRDFRIEHEGWRRYADGLRAADDPGAWTDRFYREDPERGTAPPLDGSFGCFSYARLDADKVRLHFWNREPRGGSPLAPERAAQRRAELAALARSLRERVQPSAIVVGCSWLYHLEGYRRLFPPGYLASARVARDKFRSMPLWGQFLDSAGRVRAAGRDALLSALEHRPPLNRLAECFPLQPLAPRLPVGEFAAHYGA